MKEDAKGSQQEQPVLEGEILPPLRPEPETAQAAKEAAEPVTNQYFLTQIKEAAPAESDVALTFLVNYQPVVEPKHPIEELFEKATEGLLKGTDKAVRGAVGLVNYRSYDRADKPATQMKNPGGGKAPRRP